jgi:hypothetical protein
MLVELARPDNVLVNMLTPELSSEITLDSFPPGSHYFNQIFTARTVYFLASSFCESSFKITTHLVYREISFSRNRMECGPEADSSLCPCTLSYTPSKRKPKDKHSSE